MAYDLIAPEGQFFSYIITYSGHGPYTDELRNISDPHLEAPRPRWPSPASQAARPT